MKARVIAFYLPQYHPTIDNDKWWGKGFTEWTNVGKAKPLFHGHYQPKVPADLGYYDLRLPEIREEQAKMAREAGIEGFCYYHYWFGNGKRELERPFNEVLRLGKPEYPFCLCWANESWHAKLWNKDGNYSSKMLIEQKYLGEKDYVMHFYELLPAFKDTRYIKVDGKPLFMVYKPLLFPDMVAFIKLWNQLAKENGLDGIYFVGQTVDSREIGTILAKGFDSVNLVRLWEWMQKRSVLGYIMDRMNSLFRNMPRIYEYEDMIHSFVGEEERNLDIIPTLIPNWDHTPRSGRGGYVLNNSTPELFSEHVTSVLDVVRDKPEEYRLVFLKSWNEWGEGNYMEPDLKFGKKYISSLAKIING